jgi:hypothetical protein
MEVEEREEESRGRGEEERVKEEQIALRPAGVVTPVEMSARKEPKMSATSR